jgi:hypothetical protein
MAYKHTNSRGVEYVLHSRTVKLLNSDKEQTLYFFAKEEKEGAVDELPEGYVVAESKNGLPVLKKAG